MKEVSCSFCGDSAPYARGIGQWEAGFMMRFMNTDHQHYINAEKWDEKHRQYITIAKYRCKYCPECGRKLNHI